MILAPHVLHDPTSHPAQFNMKKSNTFFESNIVMQRSTTRMFHRRWHSWKQTPYCWYNLWKCTLTRSIYPAVSGSPTASERGAKSEVAHKWANWLPHPCRIGEPHRFRAGGKIRSGPQVGKLATSPLPYRGAPPPQSGEQNQKWPTSGQIGYLTPAVSGSPTASERGAKSEVVPKRGRRGG